MQKLRMTKKSTNINRANRYRYFPGTLQQPAVQPSYIKTGVLVFRGCQYIYFPWTYHSPFEYVYHCSAVRSQRSWLYTAWSTTTLLLALMCHLPAFPEAPYYAQCKGDQPTHILDVIVLLLQVICLHGVVDIYVYTLNSDLFPKLRKHSLHLSCPSQENQSVIPLIFLVALFWPLSSAFTAFVKRWEPDLPRFREVHHSIHRVVLSSSPPNS